MIENIVDQVVNYNNPYIGHPTSKPLKISDLSERRLQLVQKLLKLYQCRPQEEYFDIYDVNAIFEDPICDALNRHEIRVQFMLMPKVFSRSETSRMSLLVNNDQELVLDLFQWYYTAIVPVPIPIRSQVRLILNNEDRIIYHGDYWYHTAAFDKFRGIIGLAWKSFRRLNATSLPIIAPYIVKLPKD